MNGFRKLFVVSAVAFIALGVALAAAIIFGIWYGFEDEIIAKCTATLVVLFCSSGVLHGIAKGMCDKPKDDV